MTSGVVEGKSQKDIMSNGGIRILFDLLYVVAGYWMIGKLLGPPIDSPELCPDNNAVNVPIYFATHNTMIGNEPFSNPVSWK